MRKTARVRPSFTSSRAFVAPMAARMAKGMDPLGALLSGSDSDADSDDAAPLEAAAKTAPANPTEAKIDYEALRKHGMKTAPTLEGIKDAGGGEGAWGWSRGSREAGRDTMTGEELHEATNAGLERACASSIEAAEAKRNARAADRERREAEVATRRRRERETRQALREDDKASRTLGAAQKRAYARSERPERDWVQDEKRALREGTGGAFGFD
jgi:hypothetical protein